MFAERGIGIQVMEETLNRERVLRDLGVELPELLAPLGSYVPSVMVSPVFEGAGGNLLFLSGVLPMVEGKLIYEGKVGGELTLEQGIESARRCAINGIAVARQHTKSLDKIIRVIQVRGFVASAPDFYLQPKVMNGCSDFLIELFGEDGRHTRSVIGTNVLPMNSPVEVDFIFECTL